MKLEDVILIGTRANQPSFSSVASGTIYYVTDESVLERSNGAAWQSYSVTALSSGMVPNGSITYAKIQNVSATSRVLARKTAGAGSVEETTLSDVLDFIGSPAQGDILYRGASTWARLGAGTSGQLLQSQGAGANPIWATPTVPTSSWTISAKASDEAANNDRGSGAGVVVNDSALQLAVAANTTYRIRGRIFFEIVNSTAGTRLVHRWTGPASPTQVNGAIITAPSSALAFRYLTAYDGSNQNADVVTHASGAAQGIAYFDFMVQNGANAGTFVFQWISGSSGAASATVRKGSYIEYQTVP